jgi:hypothetical protein
MVQKAGCTCCNEEEWFRELAVPAVMKKNGSESWLYLL